MDDQRFHLTLTTAGRPAVHGWWGKQSTADRKFSSWKDERGDVADARIVLVDEQARGDGPARGIGFITAQHCSPRTRGWSHGAPWSAGR